MRFGRVENFLKSAAMTAVSFVSGVFRALGCRACRFHPTCSCYAREAYETKNFFAASGLSVRRILRCHPFSAGGYDPVPVSSITKKES